jgi:hypothetical protein
VLGSYAPIVRPPLKPSSPTARTARCVSTPMREGWTNGAQPLIPTTISRRNIRAGYVARHNGPTSPVPNADISTSEDRETGT